jgi:hypothetical protein
LRPAQRQEFPDAILALEDEGWVRQTRVDQGGAGRRATLWELVADPDLDRDEESDGDGDRGDAGGTGDRGDADGTVGPVGQD